MRAETLLVSVAAVGERSGTADNIVDTDGGGAPRFDTFWSNKGNLNNAWATLDLGSSQTISAVAVAPRGDRDFNLALHVGDSLGGGQVTGPATATCFVTGDSSRQPTELTSCALAEVTGRYITIRSLNRAWFTLYAATVEGTNGGGTNQPPSAQAAASIGAGGMTVTFDGSGSTDADGSVVGWDWAFGDGNTGAGQTVTHTYSAAGTYNPVLTVTDELGATDSASLMVQVQPPAAEDGRLPLSIVAVGARSGSAWAALDELGDGTQNLSTFWRSNSAASTRWMTLDVGGPETLTLLSIATDRAHTLTIHVGDTLQNDQVSGGTSSVCDIPDDGAGKPDRLIDCPVAGVGRYMTVVKTNGSAMRVHGIEVFGLAGNQPPQLSFIGSQTVTEGVAFDTVVSAIDGDGPPPLDFSATHNLPGMPNLLTPLNPGTAQLLWNNTTGNIGEYPITITATDGEGAASSESFTLSVVAQQPPVVTPPGDQVTTAEQPFTFVLSALDPDGTQPVSFSESHGLPGAPQTLTDNGDNTATFNWTPAANDLGSWTVTVIATDGFGATGTASFQLTVVAGQPPVIAPIADQMIVESTLTSIGVMATDADGPGGITLDASTDLPGHPDPLVDNGDGSGSINLTPGPGDAGSYTVSVSATGGDGRSSQLEFGVDVSANPPMGQLSAAVVEAPPVVDLSAIGVFDWRHWGRGSGAITDYKANGMLLPDFSVSDGGAHLLSGTQSSYAWNDGIPRASSTGTRGGMRLLNPTPTFELRVPASTITQRLELFVGLKAATATIDLSLSDSSTSPVTLDLTQGDDRSSRQITIDFRSLSPAAELIVHYTMQGAGQWVSLEAAALAEAPNEPPKLDPIADQSVIRGAAWSLPLRAADDGPVSYSVSHDLPGNPDVLTDYGDGNAELSWTPPIATPADTLYTFTVTVTDLVGAVDSKSFTLTVLGNEPPQWQAIGNQTLIEGDELSLGLIANDADGPLPLTVTAAHSLPDGANALIDQGGGVATFSWRAPAGSAAASPYPVSFTVTDGANASAILPISITVLANLPPILAPIANQTVTAGTSVQVPLAAAFVDGPLPLSFSVSGAPAAAGIVLQDNGDGSAVLTIAPDAAAAGGPYAVTVLASDAFGISGSTSFELTVAANQAPQVNVPTSLSLVEGERIEVAVSASDPDGPTPLVLAASGDLPAGGVSFTDHGDGTGTLTIAAGAGSAGSAPIPITVEATDDFGNMSSATVEISVAPRSLLRFSQGSTPIDLNLSAEGELDWIHFGLDGGAFAINRKANVPERLSLQQSGGARISNPVAKPVVTWTDGTPEAFVAASDDAARFRDLGNGFRLSAEAAAERRRLTLYIAISRARLRVAASGAGNDDIVIDVPEGKTNHRLVYEFDGGELLTELAVEATLEAEYTGTSAVSIVAATLSSAADPAALSGLPSRPANLSCLAPLRPDPEPTLELVPAYPNRVLVEPMDLRQSPDDASRWYVVERRGRIRFFDPANESGSESALWLNHSQAMAANPDHGLLAMAFAPDFATSRRLYVTYLRDAAGGGLEQVLARFTANAANTLVDSATEEVLLVQPYASNENFGGTLVFGADGFLYWGLGDDGEAGHDPGNHAQNTSDLRGSVLRLDVAGASGYSVPTDNPFVSGGGAAEIYDFGVRDPRQLTLNTDTGKLLLADEGEREYQLLRQLSGGANHGWRCFDGTRANIRVDQGGCPPAAAVVFPIAELPRSESKAIRGGVFYSGSALPHLTGRYLFTDAEIGALWMLVPTAPGAFDRRRLAMSAGTPLLVAQASDGDVLVVDSDGTMQRLQAAGSPSGTSLSTTLSGTGCVEPAAPATPVAGVLPLGINASAFRDDAIAERHLALPNGTHLNIDSSGKVLLPEGAVALQHLRRNSALVETRLLVRHNDGGYGGYSYAWNSGGTDATLVAAAGQDAIVDGEPWRFPARNECFECHGAGPNQTPGLEVEQLNTTVTYPGASAPAAQLPTWEHIGWFDAPLLTSNFTAATVDTSDVNQRPGERARSYLHANCAQCHQPGGNAPAGLDLRFRTPLPATNTCDVTPQFGGLGLFDPRIVAPGDPENSVLLSRMANHDANRMPPLGTAGADADGVTLITNWIANLQSCPLQEVQPPLVDGGAETNNILWAIPERVLALGKENTEMWRSGFIDMSWWDGYEGFVIDPTGVQDSTDGINEVIRVAHDADVSVYAPPGTYRVTREISMKREDHPGVNCSSASRNTNVFIGDPISPPTFVLDANPTVNFNDPAAPRPVFHLWTQDGPGDGGTDCELPEHDPANADYEVNGLLYNTKASTGFRQLLRNVNIDLGTGPKAGATCFKAHAAQGTWLENIDCEARNGFAGSQSLPGRLGAVVDLEVRGGQHCLWLNEAGTAEFAMNVKCTGQSGAVLAANGRAPTTLIGFEIEHDVSLSPVFRSLDELFHFRSGAGTMQFIDGKITLTGASAGATNPVWKNSLGRNWHIANVYVSGAQPGQALIDSEGEVIVQPGTGSWTHLEQYQYTSRDPLTAPIVDPDSPRVTYASNASFQLIDGAPLSKTTLQTLHPDRPPPINIRTQHELADTPFFLEPDVVNTLTDLGITNRGERDVTADLQAAIDNHDRVFLPKGIYFVGSPGLLLGENTTLFGHNLSFTRLLWNPSYRSTDIDGAPLIQTVDSATATTRMEGFSMYRYGGHGAEASYSQTLVHWRAGAKSVWGWSWGDIYLRGPNPLIGHPGKQYRYTGNGGGRRLMFSDLRDDKTIHADHHRLVIENTTGQPLTLYNFSPEHEEGPHPFLQIRNASNIRVFGNKSECTRRFAEIDASTNVALFGHGVGCTAQSPLQPPIGGYVGPSVDGLPIIRVLGDSTDILVANSVPTLWHPTALSLEEVFQGQSSSYPTGSMVSLFKRGNVNISGALFDHQPP